MHELIDASHFLQEDAPETLRERRSDDVPSVLLGESGGVLSSPPDEATVWP